MASILLAVEQKALSALSPALFRARAYVYDEGEQSTKNTPPLDKAAAGVCALYIRYVLDKQVNDSGRQ